MLHFAKRVLTDEFLSATPNGLLLIFDEVQQRTHLGWIQKATLEAEGIKFELGLTVTQKHGTSDWERLGAHTFSIPNVERYTALNHVGGFHCTDTGMIEPTFKVYPAISIPADCARDYESLVAYGKMLR